MENDFQQQQNEQNSMGTGQQPQFGAEPPKKKSKKWFIIVAIVLVLGVAAFNVVRGIQKINNPGDASTTGSGAGGNGTAASKLYKALGNAVGQQRLQIAMLRTTYANKADADAGKQVGSQLSSVSAMDTAALTYANVFAFNVTGEGGGFIVGRCVNKVPYAISDTDAKSITTLGAAKQRLTQTLPQVALGGFADSCAQYGIPPNALPHLAYARLSDGIMPVTLEPAQATDWANKMTGTELFTVSDAGMVTRDGKQLHKYTFKPKVEASRIGVTLDEIFKQASNVEELKRQNPNASFDYAFIPLSATIASGAEGFYLIDEKTNLPTYSEINSVVKDKEADGKAGTRLNLARTKQTYTYPAQLTLDANTPLVFTE